jgi:biotin carboxylase
MMQVVYLVLMHMSEGACTLQIRAAMGKTLRFKQEDIKLKVGSTSQTAICLCSCGAVLCTQIKTRRAAIDVAQGYMPLVMAPHS